MSLKKYPILALTTMIAGLAMGCEYYETIPTIEMDKSSVTEPSEDPAIPAIEDQIKALQEQIKALQDQLAATQPEESPEEPENEPSSPPAEALPVAGSLDPTFGSGGIATAEFGDDVDWLWDLAIQKDGKIVLAGKSKAGGLEDFALVRYDTTGALDPTFDGDGMVLTPIGEKGDTAYGVAIQDDGKIVAAGSAQIGSTHDVAVVRYLNDGSLDTSFDGDGKLTYATSLFNDGALDVAVQKDGKIVDCGFATNDDFMVSRRESDGVPDTWNTKPTPAKERAQACAIQEDGTIVAAGYSTTDNVDSIHLRRYLPGTVGLDLSFDGDGMVTTTHTDDVKANDVLIQADGKIVVGGYIQESPDDENFVLVRYQPDGKLDPDFGDGGIVKTSFGPFDDEINALALQADGKIVAVGFANVGTGVEKDEEDMDVAVARYLPTGELDETFGLGGKATFSVGDAANRGTDLANAVGFQPDGTILVAGTTYVSNSYTDSDSKFFVARLRP